jgi:hypothetical protein
MTINVHRYMTDNGLAFVFQRTDGLLAFVPLLCRLADGTPVLREVDHIHENRFSPGYQLQIRMKHADGLPGTPFMALQVLEHDAFTAHGSDCTWLTISNTFNGLSCSTFGKEQDGRVWRCDDAGNRPVFSEFTFSSDGWRGDFYEGSRMRGDFRWRLDYQNGKLLNRSSPLAEHNGSDLMCGS